MGGIHSERQMLFRNLVRRAAVSLMHYGGFLLARRYLVSRHRARILVYHSISDEPLNPFSVPPADFDAQVRYLSERYRVVSLGEIASYLEEGRVIPADTVAITLDDGLQDNYTNAYPILKKYSVPATMFLVVNNIEERLSNCGKEGSAAEASHLSWAQIEEMSENGISFGSHTLTHTSLRSITLDEVRSEVEDSKKAIERRLGKPIELFAYPFGTLRDVDQNIADIVAEVGYTCACVAVNGTNNCRTGPYFLRRTKIEVNDGMYLFEKAMKGGLDIFVLLDNARRLMPRRSNGAM